MGKPRSVEYLVHVQVSKRMSELRWYAQDYVWIATCCCRRIYGSFGQPELTSAIINEANLQGQ